MYFGTQTGLESDLQAVPNLQPLYTSVVHDLLTHKYVYTRYMCLEGTVCCTEQEVHVAIIFVSRL